MRRYVRCDDPRCMARVYLDDFDADNIEEDATWEEWGRYMHKISGECLGTEKPAPVSVARKSSASLIVQYLR